MKKLLVAFAAVAAFSAHAGTLTVAASPVPHAEILEFVKPALAKEGVDLKVKVFTDYIQPNVQVAEKRLDANFFQHQPYLDEFNKAKGTNLISVAAVRSALCTCSNKRPRVPSAHRPRKSGWCPWPC